MRTRLLLEWATIAFVTLSLVGLIVVERLTWRANAVLFDKLVGFERAAATSDIAIVAIDEASLAALGRWPWPRSIHARVIDKIAAGKPAAIGYDVLFIDPSKDDDNLAKAVQSAGNVVLPMAFTLPGANGAAFDAQLPVPVIARAAHAVGHAVVQPDPDGIVRGVRLAAGSGDAHWINIAEEMFRIGHGQASRAWERIPSDALPQRQFGLTAPALIRFRGPAGTYPTVSLISVLRGEVPAAFFRGRLVLVGNTASGNSDRLPVPSGIMPGVEFLANIIGSLVLHDLILPSGVWASLAFNLIPMAFMLGALAILSPRMNILAAFAFIAMVVGASMLLLHHGVWITPIPCLLGLVLVFPFWAWRRLAAAHFYISRELLLLRADPDLLPRPTEPLRRRWLTTTEDQAQMLAVAITRLRDLRAFFADSLNGLPDPTLVINAEGKVLFGNSAAAAVFCPVFAYSIISRSLEYLISRLSPASSAFPITEHVDQEFVTSGGKTFVLRLAPLLSAQGIRLGSIARLTDITAIRVAVRQREDALELLTHDMRSPQASILAVLEMPWTDDFQSRSRIADYARRTLKLADDFVQLARAETVDIIEELLDLSEILTEAIDDQWVLAQHHGIALTFQGNGEALVMGDRTLLGRVFLNLIGNALKYSPAGTTVHCSLDLHCIGGADRQMACCTIADEGRGIADDQLDRIFQRFGRAQGLGESHVGGAGLGLSFVATVVSRHDGSVSCKSSPAKGAAFTVCLPLHTLPTGD